MKITTAVASPPSIRRSRGEVRVQKLAMADML
jgi:hypothetical protein